MTVGEMEALYERALQGFGEIAKKSVNEANNNSRKRTFAEFQEFLSRNAYGVTQSQWRQQLPLTLAPLSWAIGFPSIVPAAGRSCLQLVSQCLLSRL